MDERVAEFRKLADTFGAGKGARPAPYPERCRNLALDYAEEKLTDGASLGEISDELGVAAQTLSTWRDRFGHEMRPVRISRHEPTDEEEPVSQTPPSVSTASQPVVIMPSGARIEGLDVDGVIAVLRALG